MPAKRNGCLGKVLAVLFTSVVAPVLTNLLTEEVARWQEATEAPSAGAADWSRPAIVAPKPAPMIKVDDRRGAPNAVETPRKRVFGDGDRIVSWGRMLGR